MSNPQYQELELIQGIRNGDSSVFKYIYGEYYHPLFIYAQTIVKFSHLAEELVQETFLKIWESHAQIQITVSLKAYLYHCIHNNCLNFIRKEQVKHKYQEAWMEDVLLHAQISLMNYSEEILERIISNELEDYLNISIRELPPQCKEIFELSRKDQLTYPEIAVKLGISVNTVKTQMFRALDKLKDAQKNFKIF